MSTSLTKITTHEKCALKYKFRYILGLQETKSLSANRGVDLHRAVELKILTGAPVPPEIDYLEGWLDQLRGDSAYPEHKIAVKADWTVTGWEDPEAFMRSVLDLKYVTPEKIIIYDWKSGKIYPDHEDQKKLYAAMAHAEHPEIPAVQVQHVYLDLKKVSSTEYHKDQIPSLREEWDRRAAAVGSDTEHIPSPGYHCRWCSFSRQNGGLCRF